jgi:hypothetical protein
MMFLVLVLAFIKPSPKMRLFGDFDFIVKFAFTVLRYIFNLNPREHDKHTGVHNYIHSFINVFKSLLSHIYRLIITSILFKFIIN